MSVTFRVTAAEYVEIQQAALMADQTPSQWLRAAVRERMGQPTLVEVLVEAMRGSEALRPAAVAADRLAAAQQRAAAEKLRRWQERQPKKT